MSIHNRIVGVFAGAFLFCAASACVTNAVPVAEKDFVAQGNQYAKDGLLREATDAYRKALAQKASNATAHRNLGMVLFKSGDYKNSVAHLEKSLVKFEDDFDANFYLAEAYRARDQFGDAIFRYKIALKLKANETRAMKALAWSYFKIRYYSEALTTAKALYANVPNDEQAAIILSRTQLKLRRPAESLKTIRGAMAKADKQSLPFLKSVEGDIFYESGDRVHAGDAYRAALKDQPLLAGALLGLGRVLYDEGKIPKAAVFIERAVRVRPNLTEGHLFLGKVYEKTDPAKAQRYYQNFLKQAATDPEYLPQLDDVRSRVAALQVKDAALRNSNGAN